MTTQEILARAKEASAKVAQAYREKHLSKS